MGFPLEPPWQPQVAGKANLCLILGLLSLVCFLIFPLPLAGLVVGVLALIDIQRSNGQLVGSGRVVVGLIGSSLGLVLLILAPVLLILPAVDRVRDASQRVMAANNLRQISLALIMHETQHRKLPDPAIRDAQGQPLLSWRVALLPELGRQDLYDRFHLEEPWDSPHNRTLISEMPLMYAMPGEDPKLGRTRYLLVVGPGTAFGGMPPITMSRMRDGLSNTIFVVEVAAANAVNWTQPRDWDFEEQNPRRGLDVESGTFRVAFGDGSAHRLDASIPDDFLRRLFLCSDGGEWVDTSAYER